MSLNDAERITDRALVVTQTVNGPASLVFEAWSRPELFQRWWAPDSFGVTIISHRADVRTGGSYRLEMGHRSSEQTMVFHGRYIEVVPNARIVWTNEESDEDGPVTTVTFEDSEGRTLVTVHDLYPSKEALEDAIASGSTSGWGEQLRQLDTLVADLRAHSQFLNPKNGTCTGHSS
jgi:uncharacterized protein YndB with AHSA1/START domain